MQHSRRWYGVAISSSTRRAVIMYFHSLPYSNPVLLCATGSACSRPILEDESDSDDFVAAPSPSGSFHRHEAHVDPAGTSTHRPVQGSCLCDRCHFIVMHDTLLVYLARSLFCILLSPDINCIRYLMFSLMSRLGENMSEMNTKLFSL